MISLTRITNLLRPFASGPVATEPTDPGDLPAHLAGAIREHFEASPSLVASFPGGIHKDSVRPGEGYPYLIFTIDSRRNGFSSSTSTWSDSRIRLSSVAPGAEAAQALGLEVRDAFEGRTFDYRSGFTTAFVLDGDPSDAVAAGRAKGGNARLFRSTVEFSCMSRKGRD